MEHMNGESPRERVNGGSSWMNGESPRVKVNGGSSWMNGLTRYQRLSSPSIKEGGGGGGARIQNFNKYAIGCALLASVNSILLGYDTGIMSGAILFIKKDMNITEWQEELLVGSLSIVSLVGSVAAGRVADSFGRRWTMAVAQVFFLVGAFILGFAPSFKVLMIGRVFAGIGVGFGLMIAPVYTAEIAPANIRGSLVSLPEIFINVGILIGYIFSYILSGMSVSLGWRFMLGFGGIPAIFLICAVFTMPESPRWLVTQKRFDEAEAVLIKTSRDKAEADLRLAEIIAAAGLTLPDAGDTRKSTWPGQGIIENVASSDGTGDGKGVWMELLCPTPEVRRMLVVALGIQFFQQSTGIDATVYYSPAVLSDAGITSTSASIGATVAIGFSKTSFILVATWLLDRAGRRPLLLTSLGGMTVCLLSLAATFQVFGVTKATDDVLPNGVADSPLRAPQGSGFAPFLSAFLLCVYVAFFSVGLGPVNWVINSEVFPSRLRAQAMGLGILVNRLASGSVSLTFLSLVDAISIAGTFYLFAFMGLLGMTFVYFMVPELKGRTLEDIAKLFETQEVAPAGFVELGSAGAGAVAVHGVEASEEDGITSEMEFPRERSVEGEELTLMAHEPVTIETEDRDGAAAVAASNGFLRKIQSSDDSRF